jgi:hypothetical protein
MSRGQRANNKKKLSEKAEKLWGFIPEDGSFVTNLSLRYKLRPLGFSTEDFWTYRKELLENNLVQIGRGRGGSVARIKPIEKPKTRASKAKLTNNESKLYEELQNWLKNNQVQEIEQSGGQAWVVLTAQPEKWPRRSGHWSRPDVILVEATSYEYLPHRDIAVTTYEIKRYSPQMDNSWVFEAASHSKGAHYSYLVVEAPEERATTEPAPPELLPDLRQFGIGFGWLYLKSDTKEYEFFEVLSPNRTTPASPDEDGLLTIFAEKLKPAEKTAFRHSIGKG